MLQRVGQFLAGFEPLLAQLPIFHQVLAHVNQVTTTNSHVYLASQVKSSFIKQVHRFHKTHVQSQPRPSLEEIDIDSQDTASTRSEGPPRFFLPTVVSSYQPPKDKRQPRLIISTYNGNCWATLKAYLRCTPANVICAQEHKLKADKLTDARLWARNNGWSSFWAPAALTSEGGMSGGVAIFVKNHIQCWTPNEVDPIFSAHRGIGVLVSCGELGPCLVVSMYFFTNNVAKSAVTPSNLRLLAVLGKFIQTVGHHVCIGADWQMEQQVLSQSHFLQTLGLCVRSSGSSIGSCVSRGGQNSSTIDYFVMHQSLRDVSTSCDYCGITPPRPHRPVVPQFTAKPRDVKVVILKEPRKLPVDPPVGPRIPPEFLSDYSAVAGPLVDCCNPTPISLAGCPQGPSEAPWGVPGGPLGPSGEPLRPGKC